MLIINSPNNKFQLMFDENNLRKKEPAIIIYKINDKGKPFPCGNIELLIDGHSVSVYEIHFIVSDDKIFNEFITESVYDIRNMLKEIKGLTYKKSPPSDTDDYIV